MLRRNGYAIDPITIDDGAVDKAGKTVLSVMMDRSDETLYACGVMSDESIAKIARAAIVAYLEAVRAK